MLEEFIEWLPKALLIGAGGATLIQISPIKINPWSWLGRAIGRAINKEVIEKVNNLETEVMGIKTDMAEHDAREKRIRILRFGDEITHGIEHSKEHFDQTLMDITEYRNYCDGHPNFKNEMTILTTQQIKNAYMVRLDKNDFK